MGFPDDMMIKSLPANREDMGLIPGSGRSPGEGNGNSLQYPCLGNPVDTDIPGAPQDEAGLTRKFET